MGEDNILTVIGPIACPLKPRANKHLGGGRSKAHWSGEGSLATEQRARVRVAFRYRCAVCGVPATAVKIHGRIWADATPASACNHRALQPWPLRIWPTQVRFLDVLLVRIPSHGGRPLDEHDGLPMALKAVVDEVTAQLWPRNARGQFIGKVDDSVDWLRWLYGERPHRKPRKRPRPGDHPPDPSNVGTELLEIVIAERYCCPYCHDVPALKQRWLEGNG